MSQPTLQAWLNRKPSQKKPRKPLRRVAKNKAKDMRLYGEKRKAFLKLYPVCHVCGKKKSVDVHHMRGRLGGALLDDATWAAVCRICHDHIHAHPSEARAKGWLL